MRDIGRMTKKTAWVNWNILTVIFLLDSGKTTQEKDSANKSTQMVISSDNGHKTNDTGRAD